MADQEKWVVFFVCNFESYHNLKCDNNFGMWFLKWKKNTFWIKKEMFQMENSETYLF